MSKSSAANADWSIADEDVVEYERRLGLLRELMAEHGFDAFIARSLGMGMTFEEPVNFLSNFSLGSGLTPMIAVVPLKGEPALIVKPGFNYSFVREGKRQSWIHNVVGLDIGTDVSALEQNKAGLESAASIAKVLREAGVTSGRAAVVGGDFPGLNELKGFLPNVRFEPTVILPWTATLGGVYGDLSSVPNPFARLFSELSEWQINRLEDATNAGQLAIQAYVAAARDGATIREAAKKAKSAAVAAGADYAILHGTISSEPWGYWNLDTAAPGEKFHAGRMYFIQNAAVMHRGYGVQIARSFVIGEPTPAQRHLMKTMRDALETIIGEIRVGRTGREIWRAVNETVKSQGVEEWSQYGHNFGAHGGGMISLSNVQGDWVDGVVKEGHLLVVHPTLCHPGAGEYGMTGDCVVVQNGKARNLARRPLPHDLI